MELQWKAFTGDTTYLPIADGILVRTVAEDASGRGNTLAVALVYVPMSLEKLHGLEDSLRFVTPGGDLA